MRTHPEPGNVVQYTFDMSFGSVSEMVSFYQTWQNLIADPTLDRRFGTEFVIHPLGAVITGTFYGTQAEYEASGIPQRLPQKGNTSLVLNDWLGSLTRRPKTRPSTCPIPPRPSTPRVWPSVPRTCSLPQP